MSTTALLVEIIVIGTFALVWVTIFAFSFFGWDVSSLSGWLNNYKDWSNGIVFLTIALAYQLGWFVNQFSYFLARSTFNKTIKQSVFNDEYKNYDSIKATVYMRGSPFIVEKVKERLSVVRLTRSAFVNFLLISISLFAWGKWYAALWTLVVTVILFFPAKDMYSLYCNQMLYSYRIINSSSEKPFPVKGKSEPLKLIPKGQRTQ